MFRYLLIALGLAVLAAACGSPARPEVTDTTATPTPTGETPAATPPPVATDEAGVGEDRGAERGQRQGEQPAGIAVQRTGDAEDQQAQQLSEHDDDEAGHGPDRRSVGSRLVKELQADADVIYAANRGCREAFGAIYDVPVPTVAACHGFVLGGGIGIAGSCDVVIASEDATFGLPEIDRGALGAATHAMRMFGQQEARRMLLTGEPIDAKEAFRKGGVLEVVPREELREAARALATKIAEKSPTAVELAKWSLNGIELLDPKESYRYEQGFTLELYTSPDSQESRDAFVEKRDADFEKKK